MSLNQTQREYCQEQLLIPGSSAYYAWRFTSATWQEPWLVLACLQQTLWRIAFDYKERSIAEAKLAWWQDEIQRLGLGQPEHPIAQALLSCLPEVGNHLGLLMEWVTGYQGALQAEHVCTDADFALWARRLLAIPSLLLRAYYHVEASGLITLINQQSELALFDINLQSAKSLYHRGQLFIPLQRLQAAGIDPHNLHESVIRTPSIAPAVHSLSRSGGRGWPEGSGEGVLGTQSGQAQDLPLQHQHPALTNPPYSDTSPEGVAVGAPLVGARIRQTQDPLLQPQQEALRHLYQTWFTSLCQNYFTHWHSLHPDTRKTFHYPHALTRIHLKRCTRFLEKPQPFGAPIKDLTPLSKLWLAR